jgi:alkylation response protein AidB-like acyl-CoA dehydrogenase
MQPCDVLEGIAMDLRHSEETTELCDAFERILVRESTPSAVRGAEPLGFDPQLWRTVRDFGVPSLGLPDAVGGGGVDLRALSALAEIAGKFLAPIPLVETLVASRAVAHLGVDADEINESIFTLAVRAPTDATARLVPAGAIADQVLVLEGDDLVLVDGNESRSALIANLGCMPLADVTLDVPSRRVLLTGPAAVHAYESALHEWQVLTAASLVGLGASALALGVEYAKERKQFGVPIGSFQAVAHRLADNFTSLDGARLLVWEAAWATDVDNPKASSLASMALLFAGETAQRAAADSLHFHGGYGFMLEYDIQLYFRRAKAWTLIAGTTQSGFEDLGTILYAGSEE